MTPSTKKVNRTLPLSLTRVLAVAAPLALLCAGVILYAARRIERNAQQNSEEVILNRLGLVTATPSMLDPRFGDADGDLVADTPRAEQQLSPETLQFSYVAGPDAEGETESWRQFLEFLSAKTAKRVEAVAFSTTSDQMRALSSGKLHVTGFNTGAVSMAVTACGFVPFCTFGRPDGSFGSSMRIIVPAKSAVKALPDLKGRTVAFTVADSNSGCKAAMVLLRVYNLLPQRDYGWLFSGGHQESIRGVVKGRYQAAAVSDDLWQRAISTGEAPEDEIRTIYESERFPPATIGYAYNLAPALTALIREAFEEFEWEGTGLQNQFGVTGADRFVRISYKQDFALVRRIDDSFRKTHPIAPAEQSASEKKGP